MRNKCVWCSKISENKLGERVRLFSMDLNSVQISEHYHLNLNTVNCYLTTMQVCIAEFCEVASPIGDKVKIWIQWISL